MRNASRTGFALFRRLIFGAGAVIFLGNSNLSLAQVDIAPQFEAAREKYHLPGLMGMVIKNGRVVAQGATGVRRYGSPAELELTDRVNIGSNTKFMTACMIARLIDKGYLTWETRVRDVFVDYQDFNAAFHDATIETILSHRSGLADGAQWEGKYWAQLQLQTGSVQEVRRWVVDTILTDPPQVTPGTFLYSNQGFTVAAAMAEILTGKTWEQLMVEEVFQPANLRSAGFNAVYLDPSSDDHVVGHYLVAGTTEPTPLPPLQNYSLQNYQASGGPGGLVSCTFVEFAKWIHFQASFETNGYLKPETYQKFLTGYGGADGYGIGIWVYARYWATPGPGLSHDGQILLQSSSVYWSPSRDLAFIYYSNCRTSDGGVFDAIREMLPTMFAEYANVTAQGPHLEAPHIESLSIGADMFTFRFESLPGSTYRLLSSPDLVAWDKHPSTDDLLAVQADSEFETPSAGEAEFYRVLAVP